MFEFQATFRWGPAELIIYLKASVAAKSMKTTFLRQSNYMRDKKKEIVTIFRDV